MTLPKPNTPICVLKGTRWEAGLSSLADPDAHAHLCRDTKKEVPAGRITGSKGMHIGRLQGVRTGRSPPEEACGFTGR